MAVYSNFFLTSLLLQKYIPTHLKPKLVQAIVVFVWRYMLLNGKSILNLENFDYFD